jgi:hypothetical protein
MSERTRGHVRHSDTLKDVRATEAQSALEATGLPPMSEITYMRVEFWDNGPDNLRRFKAKFKFTTAPVADINPARLTEVMCVFSETKNFVRRMTEHLAEDDAEGKQFYEAARRSVEEMNKGLAPKMRHARLGSLYIARAEGGYQRWRKQLAICEFYTDAEGRVLPRVVLMNREDDVPIEFADNPKEKRSKNSPKWIGYYDPHGYNELRKKKGTGRRKA